jgi:hypothetical protein
MEPLRICVMFEENKPVDSVLNQCTYLLIDSSVRQVTDSDSLTNSFTYHDAREGPGREPM